MKIENVCIVGAVRDMVRMISSHSRALHPGSIRGALWPNNAHLTCGGVTATRRTRTDGLPLAARWTGRPAFDALGPTQRAAFAVLIGDSRPQIRRMTLARARQPGPARGLCDVVSAL